jgi:hypothetical protein
MIVRMPGLAQLVCTEASKSATAGIGMCYQLRLRRYQIGSVASFERRTGALMP